MICPKNRNKNATNTTTGWHRAAAAVLEARLEVGLVAGGGHGGGLVPPLLPPQPLVQQLEAAYVHLHLVLPGRWQRPLVSRETQPLLRRQYQWARTHDSIQESNHESWGVHCTPTWLLPRIMPSVRQAIAGRRCNGRWLFCRPRAWPDDNKALLVQLPKKTLAWAFPSSMGAAVRLKKHLRTGSNCILGTSNALMTCAAAAHHPPWHPIGVVTADSAGCRREVWHAARYSRANGRDAAPG